MRSVWAIIYRVSCDFGPDTIAREIQLKIYLSSSEHIIVGRQPAFVSFLL